MTIYKELTSAGSDNIEYRNICSCKDPMIPDFITVFAEDILPLDIRFGTISLRTVFHVLARCVGNT